MVAVVVLVAVWCGLVTSPNVVRSTAVQLQPVGAVTALAPPMVMISVQLVTAAPTVNVPATAPPAVAASVQPLLVVNFVPVEM